MFIGDVEKAVDLFVFKVCSEKGASATKLESTIVGKGCRREDFTGVRVEDLGRGAVVALLQQIDAGIARAVRMRRPSYFQSGNIQGPLRESRLMLLVILEVTMEPEISNLPLPVLKRRDMGLVNPFSDWPVMVNHILTDHREAAILLSFDDDMPVRAPVFVPLDKIHPPGDFYRAVLRNPPFTYLDLFSSLDVTEEAREKFMFPDMLEGFTGGFEHCRVDGKNDLPGSFPIKFEHIVGNFP